MAIDEKYFYGAHGIDIEKAKQERIIGHCKDCKHFREIPYHIDICIQHTELCPKGDWHCADYEPQESESDV